MQDDFIGKLEAIAPDRPTDTTEAWAARAAAMLISIGQSGMLTAKPEVVENQLVELLARMPINTLMQATFLTMQARAIADAASDF